MQKAAGADRLDAVTSLKLEVVSLLHEIGRKDFVVIDGILGLELGASKRVATQYPQPYRVWTEKHIDECIQSFYRSKITLLEHLITAAPSTILMWKNIQADTNATMSDRGRAAREIREWTKLFLSTKQSSAVRELIPPDLMEDHDRAEELCGQLHTMMGNAARIMGMEPDADGVWASTEGNEDEEPS